MTNFELIKKVLEALTLGMRGIETKTAQKTNEILKDYIKIEAKERQKEKEAKKEL